MIILYVDQAVTRRSIYCWFLMWGAILMAGCKSYPTSSFPKSPWDAKQVSSQTKFISFEEDATKETELASTESLESTPAPPPAGVETNTPLEFQLVKHEGGDAKVNSAEYVETMDATAAVPVKDAPRPILESETQLAETSPVFQLEGPVTLDQIEQLALQVNPAIGRARANIAALRGKLCQVGLPPNPTLGFVGDDINEAGGGGRYGIYFGRKIVTANKLGLSRSVARAEISAAEQRLFEVEQRILTDVRMRYFDLLIAEKGLNLANELQEIAASAVDVSKALYDANEVAKSVIIQAELELENARVVQQQAGNRRLGVSRKLAVLLGENELPDEFKPAEPEQALELMDFELAYDQLLQQSPELAALFAEVEQARRQLRRECVQPIPDVTWQAAIQYGTATNDVVSAVQIGMPIPTLNRNQGAISRAQNSIVAKQRIAETKALNLRQRLAAKYESFLDAKYRVDALKSSILPKAKEALDLNGAGYRAGEVDFLQLLTSQRTYSATNLNYLFKLQQMFQDYAEIKGMLLSNGLQ